MQSNKPIRGIKPIKGQKLMSYKPLRSFKPIKGKKIRRK